MSRTSTEVNPSRRTMMEYVPGGSSGTVKPPDSFVVAMRSKEVALFWTVMLAPAMAAEFWSSTVPLKVAAVDWAAMGVKYKGTRTKRNKILKIDLDFNIFSLSM